MRADQNEIVGVKRLIAMREAGNKPEIVFVLMTSSARLTRIDFAIAPSANIARLDFRPFVGLNVVLMAHTAGDRPRAAFRKLCEVADSVVVCFTDKLPEGDCGWRFVRGTPGLRRVGDAPGTAMEIA